MDREGVMRGDTGGSHAGAPSCPDVYVEIIGLLILTSSVLAALAASYVREAGAPAREECEELRPAA